MPTSRRLQRRRGFSLLEILVFILLIGILLPALGAARRTARQMANNTQLRGIHQGMVTFAQTNKKGGNDGYFPGLDATGNLLEPDPSGRLQMMLEGNFFTPEYVVNPADSDVTVAEAGQKLSPLHQSYAMLPIANPVADAGRIMEWKETLNTAALVLSDRNTGTVDAVSSVWTERNSDDWRGGVTRNDNSTSFETTTSFIQTKYGNHPANEQDELFVSETPAGSDALMIHQIHHGDLAAK